MFILDTNVISELRKARAGKANRGVTDWASDVPAALMFMSVISLHELEHGVLLAELRDPAQGKVLREWLDKSVVVAFADRLLSVDEHVAREAAALHVPDPAPFRDALIAATAKAHAMSIITRNCQRLRTFRRAERHQPLDLNATLEAIAAELSSESASASGWDRTRLESGGWAHRPDSELTARFLSRS